jgi:hypothetical protein
VSRYVWAALDLDAVVALLRDCPARWWIAGGHALELFLGRKIREHEDVDVLVLRSEQRLVQQHLRDWDLRVARGGRLREWRAGERLELPDHAVWARLDPNGPWQLELVFGEDTAGAWHYRRDPSISVPLDELGRISGGGVPYVRPELILLFKAKSPRERDEADLEAVLPALDEPARARLAAWLPAGHPWLGRL